MTVKDLHPDSGKFIPNITGHRWNQRTPFTVGLWNKWLADFNARQQCNTGRVDKFRGMVERVHPTQDD